MRLEGKVALITGAAAGVEGELMGFGGASAHLFTREGAKVVLCDINEEMGEKTASQVRDNGGDAIFVRLDVTSEQDWADAIKTTISSFGRLDILVNNAGTGARFNVEDTTVEVWDGQMDVHAKGVFLGTKFAIPEMRKVGGGSIINTSSIYGIVGSQTSAAYHAAKGAIRIFTKAAAIQYAGDNIRVNSVHPGFAATPMTRESYDDPERYETTLERIPMGRVGNANEIAYGILYLASDESSFVTGSEIVIDGGVTAQ
ncbi:MAG: glucose 1-dehydrogenase [Chloroflexi bacterium]|nr:glucose 1-dehydrogenase [Chloroflexota bacterium]